MREIVFDTETTGFNPRGGDRVIEIGAVEIIDLIPTGQTFHCYINPERDVPADAVKVHGLTADFLRDKPLFSHPEVGPAFYEFVGDARLVAHNAKFDRGFIDMELERIGLPLWGDEQWLDTYRLAQQQFPGSYNSLDALCKRFNISLESRDLHGALIDAKLLASVYLELNGGRERRLSFGEVKTTETSQTVSRVSVAVRPEPLPSRLTEAERAAHAEFIAELGDDSLWAQAQSQT